MSNGALILSIRLFADALFWLIMIRVILSWVPRSSPRSTLARFEAFIYQVTEPILAPVRRLIPGMSMGLDLSPLLAILAISVIENILIGLLR